MTPPDSTSEFRMALANAGLGRRLAVLLYDGFLIVAIWMMSSLLLLAATDANAYLEGIWYQAFLYAELMLFYVYFWSFRGQTLGMQVWRVIAIQEDGKLLSPKQASIRFLIATLSLGCFGLGLLWILVNPQKLAFHDLASHSRIVYQPKN